MARHEQRHEQAQALRERVGARIRAAQGPMKNRELADRVGIDVRLLQKHKAGDNMPSTDNLTRYAHVLGKPLTYFFETDGNDEVAA